MQEIKIQDLKNGLVEGVEVYFPSPSDTYKETYFEWTASHLTAGMSTNSISGGVLKAWHHLPIFNEVESHVDKEMFYFTSGTALMLFVDIKDGNPDMKTAQIVRVKQGTQLIISAGKGHFIPAAESEEAVTIIVVGPKMDAPRVALTDTVLGI